MRLLLDKCGNVRKKFVFFKKKKWFCTVLIVRFFEAIGLFPK